MFPLIAAALSKWCELTNACEEAQMEYQLTLIETLDGLLEWKNRHDRMLLLNSSMTDVTAAEVSLDDVSCLDNLYRKTQIRSDR